MSFLDLRVLPADRWIPVPGQFPVEGPRWGRDAGTWGRFVADAWWQDYGIKPRRAARNRLEALLTFVAENYPRAHPLCACYAHLDSPHGMPLGVFFSAVEAEARDDEAVLRGMTAAVGDDTVEPPLVEKFTSPHLGTGLRVLRYFTDDDGDVAAGLRYGWRCGEGAEKVDVVISVVSVDHGHLMRAMTDIDDAARTIRIRPDAARQA